MKRVFTGLLVLNVSLCLCLYYSIPSLRPALQSEDMFIENATALFFFMAAAVGTYYLVNSDSKFLRKLCMFIACLGLVACLDELSFGERYFNLTMPLIGSQKVDGFHDLFKLCFNISIHIIKRIPVPAMGALVLVTTAVLIFIAYKNQNRLLKITNNITKAEPYFYLRASIALLIAATLIDFDIVHNETLFLLEELFEMNAGLALLFSCINVLLLNRSKKSPTAKSLIYLQQGKSETAALYADPVGSKDQLN